MNASLKAIPFMVPPVYQQKTESKCEVAVRFTVPAERRETVDVGVFRGAAMVRIPRL